MKSLLLSGAILVFISLIGCQKSEPVASGPADLSLLFNYNWQRIIPFVPVNGKPEGYTKGDTVRYSFSADNYEFLTQHTTVRMIYGQGEPQYIPMQSTNTSDGGLFLNPSDSTLILETISSDDYWMMIERRWRPADYEEIIEPRIRQSVFKIRTLNRDSLVLCQDLSGLFGDYSGHSFCLTYYSQPK